MGKPSAAKPSIGAAFVRSMSSSNHGSVVTDSVVKQIKSLYRKTGGFGHLIAMMHAGSMSYKDCEKSMKLFAKEVMPQIKDLGTVSDRFGPLEAHGKPIPAAKGGSRTQALAAMYAKFNEVPKPVAIQGKAKSKPKLKSKTKAKAKTNGRTKQAA